MAFYAVEHELVAVGLGDCLRVVDVEAEAGLDDRQGSGGESLAQQTRKYLILQGFISEFADWQARESGRKDRDRRCHIAPSEFFGDQNAGQRRSLTAAAVSFWKRIGD